MLFDGEIARLGDGRAHAFERRLRAHAEQLVFGDATFFIGNKETSQHQRRFTGRMLALARYQSTRVASAVRQMSGRVDAKLAELGHTLPPPSKPVASYVMATRVGNMIYTGACAGVCRRVAAHTRTCGRAFSPRPERRVAARRGAPPSSPCHARVLPPPPHPQRATCHSPPSAPWSSARSARA